MNATVLHHLTQQAATLPMAEYLELIEQLVQWIPVVENA